MIPGGINPLMMGAETTEETTTVRLSFNPDDYYTGSYYSLTDNNDVFYRTFYTPNGYEVGGNSTIKVPTYGKWYWEFSMDDPLSTQNATYSSMLYSGAGNTIWEQNNTLIGGGISFSPNNSFNGYKVWLVENGIGRNTALEPYFGSYSSSDVYMIAYDADNHTMWVGKNGTWIDIGNGSKNPASGSNPDITNIPQDEYWIMTSCYNAASPSYQCGVRYRGRAEQWAYSAPIGFNSLQDVDSVSNPVASISSQSIKIGGSTTDYLSRTLSATGNMKKWTWSGWVNLQPNASADTFFAAVTNEENRTTVGRAEILYFDGNGISGRVSMNGYPTTTDEWHHYVFIADHENPVVGDRMQIWIDGVRWEGPWVFETYPSTVYNSRINNSSVVHYIGAEPKTFATYTNNYFYDVNFIDDAVVFPDKFGYSINNTWQPKAYTGSYSGQSFHLKFDDPANLGKDSSGLGNHWNVNGTITPTLRTPFVSASATQSVSFDGVDDYLEFIPDEFGNQRIWSVSWWERGEYETGTDQTIFSSYSDANNYMYIFRNGGTPGLRLQSVVGGAVVGQIHWDAMHLSDTTAWRHCMITFNANTGDCDLYINNEIQTKHIDTSIVNGDHYIGYAGAKHSVGSINGTLVLAGDMYQFYYINNQTTTPSSFGMYDTNGIWVPKSFEGTVTTTDMYYAFENNMRLGDHNSINSDFITLNPEDKTYAALLDSTNLILTTNGNVDATVAKATLGLPNTGKYYFEYAPKTSSGDIIHQYVGCWGNDYYTAEPRITYSGGGSIHRGNTLLSSTAAVFTTTSVIGVCVDMDNRKFHFRHNNVIQGGEYNLPEEHLGTLKPAAFVNGNRWGVFNFGQNSSFANTFGRLYNTDANGEGDFRYTPPNGYVALKPSNLPNIELDTSAHFETLLYKGNGNQRIVKGTDWEGDDQMVWIKSRTQDEHHLLYDSVRGPQSWVGANIPNAAIPEPTGLTVFDNSGFELGDHIYHNGYNHDYVAWRFRAGTSTTDNSGTVPAVVSANQTFGFSIVKFTATSADQTVMDIPHGLGKTPGMIILKATSRSDNWHIWVRGMTDSEFFYFTTVEMQIAGGPTLWGGAFDDQFFKAKTGNTVLTNDECIVYCFAESDYINIFSYKGDGLQPWIYTHGNPIWAMLKGDYNGGNWLIHDRERAKAPVSQSILIPSNFENETTNSTQQIEFKNTGIQIQNTNLNYNSTGTEYFGISILGASATTTVNGNDMENYGMAQQTIAAPNDVLSTLNPLVGYQAANLTTLTDYNNAVYVPNTSSNAKAYGSIGMVAGRMYEWQIYIDDLIDWQRVGINSNNSDSYTRYVYYHDGNKEDHTTITSYAASWTTGDIITVRYDAINGQLEFLKNNVSQGIAFTGIDTSITWFPFSHIGNGSTAGNKHTYTFDSNKFTYTIGAGYVHVSTANLPTPTISDNSYATLDPDVPTTYTSTFSNGNLSVSHGGGGGVNQNNWYSTIAVTGGKYHFEATCTGNGSTANGYGVGISPTRNGTAQLTFENGGGQIIYDGLAGNIIDYSSGSQVITSYGTTFASGARIAMEIDFINNRLEYFVNGISQGYYTPSGTLSDNYYYTVVQDRTYAATIGYDMVYDEADFVDTPTDGFVGFSNSNIPLDVSQHFETLLYTGNGGTQTIVGSEWGYDDQLVWIKDRSPTAYGHVQFDSLRGFGEWLSSNSPVEQSSGGNFGWTSGSFNSNGFTVVNGSNPSINGSGSEFVAWRFRAGKSYVDNSGTLSATVSANPTLGFSIVKWVGDGGNVNLPHGLGKAPKLIIIKNLDQNTDWFTRHTGVTNNRLLKFNSNVAANSFDFGNFGAMTDTTFNVQPGNVNATSVNGSGNNMIAYCFTDSIFMDVNVHTGNSQSDGAFNYSSGKPVFSIIKRIDVDQSWVISDSVRNPTNPVTKILNSDTTAQENPVEYVDYMATGMKMNANTVGANANGSPYATLVIKEPFGGDIPPRAR